jgi:hypothetical protein
MRVLYFDIYNVGVCLGVCFSGLSESTYLVAHVILCVRGNYVKNNEQPERQKRQGFYLDCP